MNGHVEGRVGIGYCTSPSLELNVLKLTACKSYPPTSSKRQQDEHSREFRTGDVVLVVAVGCVETDEYPFRHGDRSSKLVEMNRTSTGTKG